VLITTLAFQLIIRIAIAIPLDLSTPEYHRSEDRVCIQKGEYPRRTTAVSLSKLKLVASFTAFAILIILINSASSTHCL
jgi:hypothetical protein